MLALDHLGVLSPPGCGDGSPCRAATSSRWGSVPGVKWPVSFLGFAYYLAALFAWIRARGAWSSALQWLARAGALGSLFFIGVMLVEKLPCKYCLASHIANLLFLGISEFSARRAAPRPATRGLAAMAGIFAVASVGLGFAEAQVQKDLEAQRNAAANAIIEKSKPKAAPAPQPAQTPQAQQPAAAPFVMPAVFTGRYRWGPEVAPIRIVMWTGYQCPDCKKIDPQIREIMAKRKDVSISVKHFPFCPDCNPHIVQNNHPNGCWAARAAEAAGILKGSDGFWKMHEWLFSRGGSFTDKDLLAILLQFGWDANTFIQTMQGPTTLRNVQNDCEEAVQYGLRYSPMIFINGIELKAWNAPDSVTHTVEQVAAASPEPAGPEADRPIRAADKFIADWREQPSQAWPTRANLPALGNPTAPVKISLFGDLLEPTTAEADRNIRDMMAGRNDIWYEFRYFPADSSCNPSVPKTLFPGACRAVRAAEAANALGGSAAYWKMHEWIQAHAKEFNDTTLRAAATEMGLNADELLKKMEDPALIKMVDFDNNIGGRLKITEIPRIAVNGKHIPRWKLPGQFVLERIVEEAANPEQPK